MKGAKSALQQVAGEGSEGRARSKRIMNYVDELTLVKIGIKPKERKNSSSKLKTEGGIELKKREKKRDGKNG